MTKPLSPLDGLQTLQGAFNDDEYAYRTIILGSLVPESYDEIDLSYTVDDLTGVVYKLDGATVATLTLTYTLGKLTKVERA